MNNFQFYNPVKAFFGKGQLTKLPKLLAIDQKILIIYGGGSIKANGVYDGVKTALAGYDLYEFAGIEPNPRYETCMKVVELIKEKKIDWLLAVGGGSVIDATKFIAAAALYTTGDPWDILANKGTIISAMPFGSVLTLPATGSEMNSASVITRSSTTEKLAFMSEHTFPKFSILLPDAAGTLPKRQVANGVVDAFVHVIEQYLTYPCDSPLQDRLAESILQTLVEVGPRVVENPADYSAMSTLMWSATMALNGVIDCGVPGDWSIHMIGHELTALYEIDHARTLAIVLPGLWKSLRNEKREKLLQFGERVWNVTQGTEDERIDLTIQKTSDFFESLGIPTKLTAYQLGAESIELIVKRINDRGWSAFGDRQLITPAKVKTILEFQLA